MPLDTAPAGASSIISDLTVYQNYAKHLHQENRRETYAEVVTRGKEMHQRKFPQLHSEIEEAFKSVYKKEVFQSMRAAQFSGEAIERNNSRIFNCCYCPVDSVEAFSETIYLLLGGSGVGYSVQPQHIAKLPPVSLPTRTKKFYVQDDIEGWADAVKAIVGAYLNPEQDWLPDFDFSLIRAKGVPLKTTGGKAPGPEPIKLALTNISNLLGIKEEGSRLKSIEAHDIQCFSSDSVMAGGIRRAAMIVLFSLEDEDMMGAKGNFEVLNTVEFHPKTPGNYLVTYSDPGYGVKTQQVYLSEEQLAELLKTETLPWYLFQPQRGRANNSALILRGSISKRKFNKTWKKIESSGSGEPAIIWTNDLEWGFNPCVSGDTSVLTSEGPRLVSDLIGEQFEAVVNGKPYKSTERGFFQTGHKELLNVSTASGNSVRVTKNHKILTLEGDREIWKEAGCLLPGDQVVLGNNKHFEWQGEGTWALGWLIGSLVGDGNFASKNKVSLEYWGDNKEEQSTRAAYLLSQCNMDFYIYRDPNSPKIRVYSYGLADFAKSLGISKGNKFLTREAEELSSDFSRGLCAGYFDADGTVQNNKEKGSSIRLSSVSLKNISTVQRILGRIGIISKVYRKRRAAGYYMLPDAKGGLYPCHCQESLELHISKSSIYEFYGRIILTESKKQERIEAIVNNGKRNLYKSDFFSEVIAVEADGTEPVYDCTIPEVSRFEANGIIVHNCVEAALPPYTFCNLTTISCQACTTQEKFNQLAGTAAFIGTLQASYTDFKYLRPIWKEMTEQEALLGVSLTGVANESFLALDERTAALRAVQSNQGTAKLIGINPAARVTNIKPEGKTSLVAVPQEPSGIHAFHGEFYITNRMVSKSTPLFAYLNEKLPGLLRDNPYSPEFEALITIPVRGAPGVITRSEPVIDLLERIKRYNKNWIEAGHQRGVNRHNVSATVTIRPGEWERVGLWLWENREAYSGISVLPEDGGTYLYTPNQDCSEEEYERLSALATQVDLREVYEPADETELSQELACSGGACSI